ncbi:MAG: M14 family zinc carboxypeptidase, partial [Wenzhouxiangellaceae bacterium]
DPDADTPNAGPESSLLINGGIHAREWGTPELTTGLIEAFAAGAGDGWLYDYLIDHVHFTVVPVNNVDGFVQTQRFPTEVLVGADPRVPEFWPRDGRMRRKNMRGADTDLLTFFDHLRGVDLNRNNEPFWATSTSSSANPDELVYHGFAAFSEPETRVLMEAAELARPERLRWYEDVHSFTQVLFSITTFNLRRNLIQSALLTTFREFHDALSLQRHGVSRVYTESPDRAGFGIGVTPEYFATQYQVPAWTLEIEPRRSASEYGGLGTEHDGFILPDSEVRRLRDDMALTHAVLAYRQAGPPAVQRVTLERADDGVVVFDARWQFQGDGGRARLSDESEPLLPRQRYRIQVTFDKPMRWTGPAGAAEAPGHPVALAPSLRLGIGQPVPLVLDGAGGQWLTLTGGAARYDYDTWRDSFSVPTELAPDGGRLTLEIAAEDFTGQALDADPATVVDFVNGAWSGYENTNGVSGDVGGADRATDVAIATVDEARRILLRRRGDDNSAGRSDLLPPRGR